MDARTMAPALDVTGDFELLPLCARMDHNAATAELIRAKVSPGHVDWDGLVERAHEHRVLPLVCRALERIAPDLVPETTLTGLRRAYRTNAARNLSLTAELLRVLDVLAAQKIACIPYKGPVLAATAYGDISLRQFADLDVIVPSGDVHRALEALTAVGYEPETPEPADAEGFDSRTSKDIVLHRDAFELELHWGITTDMFHPIQVTSELLWDTAETSEFRGRPIYIFGPETNLLVHCIHGVSHGWQRMGWVCDIAEIVRSRTDIDWHRVNEIAAALGARRLVNHSLALAKTLLDVPLPSSVVRELESDPALPPLTARTTQWLVTGGVIPLGELQRYYLNVREHKRHKLRVLYLQTRSYLSLTARDAEALDGGPRWLLYVLRPFRLVRDYGLAPFFRFVKGVFQV